MESPEYDARTRALRYLARALSTAVTAFILMFVIGGIVDSIRRGTFEAHLDYEPVMMMTYSILILAGSLLGWWKDILGGVILSTAGAGFVLHAMLTLGSNDWWLILIFALPFLASGSLLIYCGRRDRKGSPQVR